MTRRLSLRSVAILVAAAIAAPAANAFTIDDGADKRGPPKFDLEEQSGNFRTPSLDLSTPGLNSVETPFGTMHFGLQSSAPTFGSDAAARDRRHYERMFAPDFMKDR
jgi:hypothetical protein